MGRLLLGRANGCEVNASSLGQDVGVSGRTILNYLEILEDTLIAFQLPVWRKSTKRRPTSRKKLYFFDLGLANALAKTGQIQHGSNAFDHAFEHFIILEVRAAISYHSQDIPIYFWRTSSGQEVDLIIGDDLAIEIKASEQVSEKHLKGLRALKEEGCLKRYILVSMDPKGRQTMDGIEVFTWQKFLESLWAGHFFKS